jgi:hypothetical protein
MEIKSSTYYKKFLLLAAIIMIQLAARAQEKVTIPRIEGEIKFDGIVDDACWKNIKPFAIALNLYY